MLWELIAHGWGDYILQSDWMANEKTKKSTAAAIHALVYTLPFLFLTLSWKALVVICITHFLIDRFRLAKYVCWLKNFLGPRATFTVEYVPTHTTVGGKEMFTEKTTAQPWWFPWSECTATGYHKDKPVWMSVWLLIITDNLLHITINALALRFL